MNQTSLITEAAILAEVNKGVGVLIAVIGAIITSPSGWRRLLSSSARWVHAQINRVRRTPPPQVINVSGIGSSEISGNASFTNEAPHLNRSQPLEDQISAVHAYVRSVESRFNHLARTAAEEKTARDGQMSELQHLLETRFEKLEERLIKQDRETARIDARGIPLITAGIVLSGVPEWLASLPLHLGWLLPVTGLFLAGIVLGSLQARTHD